MHPATICGWDALAINANSGASCATIQQRGRGRPSEFASETAAITGESKSQVNRHVARADALGDDLDRLVGISLDKLRTGGEVIQLRAA